MDGYFRSPSSLLLSLESLSFFLPEFACSTIPGLGYGRIWKRVPLTVESTPVFLFSASKPADHLPLQWKTKIKHQPFSIQGYCEREIMISLHLTYTGISE